MKRRLYFSLLLALLALSPVSGTLAQSGAGHILYGDFKVDESKVGGLKPINFDLDLYAVRGSLVARQKVGKNGRYRFDSLRNGEYVIVVQMENVEVARVRAVVYGATSGDFRQDILLEWSPALARRKDNKPGVVAAPQQHTRTPANNVLFNKAEEALKRKDRVQALLLLRQLVEADPKDFEAWTEIGTIHFIEKNNAEAEKAYVRALAELPSFGLALLNLGKLRMAQNNFPGAISVLTRAVKAQPSSADANQFLGEAYLYVVLNEIRKKSDTIEYMNEAARKAVEYLSEAIRLDPTGKAEIHLRLADIYNALDLKAQAVAECEKFLAKKPDYPSRKKLEQFISENKKP